jgi:hypothetical protein
MLSGGPEQDIGFQIVPARQAGIPLKVRRLHHFLKI